MTDEQSDSHLCVMMQIASKIKALVYSIKINVNWKNEN